MHRSSIHGHHHWPDLWRRTAWRHVFQAHFRILQAYEAKRHNHSTILVDKYTCERHSEVNCSFQCVFCVNQGYEEQQRKRAGITPSRNRPLWQEGGSASARRCVSRAQVHRGVDGVEGLTYTLCGGPRLSCPSITSIDEDIKISSRKHKRPLGRRSVREQQSRGKHRQRN